MAIGTATAIMGGAALLSAGASAYGAKKAGDAADDARDSENYWRGQQVDTAKDQLAWNKNNYDQWVQEFAPVLDELKAEALAGRTPDYAKISADASAAFGSQRDQKQRALGRYGIQPGDGQWDANERRFGIGEAGAEINARQDARRSVENDRFSRLANVYGYGAGMTTASMGGVNQGFGMIQGAQGGASAMHGRQAREYGGLARENAAGAWRGFNGFLDQAMNMGGGGTEPAGAPGGGWGNPGHFGG